MPTAPTERLRPLKGDDDIHCLRGDERPEKPQRRRLQPDDGQRHQNQRSAEFASPLQQQRLRRIFNVRPPGKKRARHHTNRPCQHRGQRLRTVPKQPDNRASKRYHQLQHHYSIGQWHSFGSQTVELPQITFQAAKSGAYYSERGGRIQLQSHSFPCFFANPGESLCAYFHLNRRSGEECHPAHRGWCSE